MTDIILVTACTDYDSICWINSHVLGLFRVLFLERKTKNNNKKKVLKITGSDGKQVKKNQTYIFIFQIWIRVITWVVEVP